VGAVTGLVVSSTLGGTLAGGAIGGAVGGAIGLSKQTKKTIIKELQQQNIQFVQYGDTLTLIVPSDQYFIFNSPRLNEICYHGLENIAQLIKLYPPSPVYVGAFTDNVGTAAHKRKMSQAQAETMMSYLWAQGIRSQCLKPEGYGDKNDIADNSIIHGSAMNRRIEIQWFNHHVRSGQAQPAPYFASK
jgi:outer membrane protein OmpA-like peptidoglycan-associated protein